MLQRIVLALDTGDAGTVAASFTVALARRTAARVHVVHVNEYLLGGRWITNESVAEAAGVVADCLGELQAAGISASGVTYRTTPFDTATTIAEVATQWQADAIVVGSRRRRLRPRLRSGTRDRVARISPLPVLTAPAPLRVSRRDKKLRRTLEPVDIAVRS